MKESTWNTSNTLVGFVEMVEPKVRMHPMAALTASDSEARAAELTTQTQASIMD